MKINKVTDLSADELSVYVGLNEKQLKRYYEPDGGVFICESEKVLRRAIDAGYEAESFFVEEEKLKQIEDLIIEGVPVYVAPASIMKEITGYSLTGGILASMRRKPNPNFDTLLADSNKLVILDDVENPTNVGAIFRSAAALGADAVLLTQGCADPFYRRAARVSMGTVFQIKWSYITLEDVSRIKDSGFTLYALSLSDTAISLGDEDMVNAKRAVVLGNEDSGISKDILEICDKNVIIPMKNNVDSLNVAAASAVAFWEIFKD